MFQLCSTSNLYAVQYVLSSLSAVRIALFLLEISVPNIYFFSLIIQKKRGNVSLGMLRIVGGSQ